MKKILSGVILAVGMAPMMAAEPEAIYIGTWETMQELGQPIAHKSTDPVLTYNSESGCYEGEVIDWPRLAVNPYNAKIPYSVQGDEITYYGVAGSTVQFSFNTEDSYTFEFTANTDPSDYKGFGLSMVSNYAVADVKVSMNLSTDEITFTRFESGQGAEIPVFESVYPENGEEITPDDNGVVVTLQFSGEVTSMEAISDGILLPTEANEDGTVWNILISQERIEALVGETQGLLSITVQKVYSYGLPVSFDNGSSVLHLSYPVAGLTHEAKLSFTGSEDALETLNVYKYPEYTVGDEVELEDNILSFTFTEKVTYLFTAGKGYGITITSDIDSNDGENWALGEGSSYKKGSNGESTGEVASEGVTLTIYPGASGAEFTISVTPDEASVNNIKDGRKVLKVYGIDGLPIITTENSEDINSLAPGIYIVNGKKIIVK